MASINFKVTPATDDPGCWIATIKGSKREGKASSPLLAIMRLIERIHCFDQDCATKIQRKFDGREQRKQKKRRTNDNP